MHPVAAVRAYPLPFAYAGYLIGSGIFGTLADALGRRLALASATVIGSVFAAATAAAGRRYWLFAAMRLFTGIGVAGARRVAAPQRPAS